MTHAEVSTVVKKAMAQGMAMHEGRKGFVFDVNGTNLFFFDWVADLPEPAMFMCKELHLFIDHAGKGT